MISFRKMSFLLICVFSTALLASLLIPYSSVHLRNSTSLYRLWITSQLIVLIIWKISPAKSDADQPQQRTELDLPPGVEDPALELSWYSPPSNEPAAPEEAEREVAISTENPSMDDAWRAIVAGRGKPVLRKSETWERRGRGEAERAAAAALRRSDTAKGWRRREKLVESQEELLQRVEKFIEKHYDHLRLQKQESESRRFLERQLLRH
ncbi:uncharacterized protein LOC121990615 [Zingiber officinale]|uniref:Uncharacterized protein n=1 Tax=Zingiber officinale TaxID=94328 RepID=A0A8J5FZT2_ZINOF|nr:uncharacterized protein LOC121990615 [Zingiber officinale]KAG6497865.1 hypothetical protein ZIOFF_045771 [Zingiber officinale]